MARVLLLSAAPGRDADYNRGAFVRLERSAQEGVLRDHSLTNDPEAADLILFAELKGAGPYFERVRRHPLVRNFREKCFLFCPNPFVIPFLPGVYTSIEKRWSSRRTRPGFYLGVSENEFLEFTPPRKDLPYLYSFVGSINNAPIRRRLPQLRHPRSFFQDTTADYAQVLSGTLGKDELRKFWRRYAETMQASKFVLCPRGLSVSSVRLFDAMRIGRVPVILSDDWIEPIGPAWERFSIRIPEREFECIPEVLEKCEDRAVAMGELARKEWEEWFSQDVCFHRVIDWCLQIKSARRIPERWAGLIPYLQYARPFHFRHRLRTWWQRVRESNPCTSLERAVS